MLWCQSLNYELDLTLIGMESGTSIGILVNK